MLLAMVAGCHRDTTPHATAQDIETTQQEAQKEVTRARIEATKDLKSAAKVAQVNPKEVLEAKVTGKYDIAMVQADGDHKVAVEKCLTLPAPSQADCKNRADSDYETAKQNAKATRLARQQSL
jgi:hypothetical protein